MSIAFSCLECGDSYDVDDDMAGRTIRCRECHGFGRVEAPRKKLPPKVPAPSTTEQENSLGPASATKWLSRKPVYFAFLLGGALSGILGAGALLLLRSVDSPSAPSQPVVQKANFSRHQPDQLRNPQKAPSQAAPQPAFQQPAPPQVNAAQVAAEQQIQQQRLAEAQWRQEQAEQKRIAAAIAEVENKRQQQLATEFALLSKLEQGTVQLAIQTLSAREPGIVSLDVLDRYRVFLDDEPCRRGIRAMADRFSFREFCDNLAVPAGQRDALVMPYLFQDSSGRRGLFYFTGLAVSREYKRAGLAGLPSPYKKYVSANRELFAPILK